MNTIAFDKWFESTLIGRHLADVAEIAFNAGRDSLVSQRECYQRGYAAGKKAGMEVEDE